MSLAYTRKHKNIIYYLKINFYRTCADVFVYYIKKKKNCAILCSTFLLYSIIHSIYTVYASGPFEFVSRDVLFEKQNL